MNPLTLVIFGITGNLSQIKLLPALYSMAENNLLPKQFRIIGSARSPMTKDEIRKYVKSVIQTNLKKKIDIEVLDELVDKIDYIDGHLDDVSFYKKLKAELGDNSQDVIYYLATYPELYSNIFKNLKRFELNRQLLGWVRLMIEKPLGDNLKSAKKLNRLLQKYFKEEQIFRLDHYLGKETIQNILTFRFGNNIFEPLTNEKYIDHIQITSAEEFGIGKRAGYFDKTGSLKDVGQNHILQMIAFTLMEAPETFSNAAITKQRLKILKSLIPEVDKIVFGQYEGYTNEENVAPKSQTETFFAFKTHINDIALSNIPIYVRSGKNLPKTVTEIAIIFKEPVNKLLNQEITSPNILIYRIQPNEGIILKIYTKKPGHSLEVEEENMQFCYRIGKEDRYFPDPYEKLIVATIRGDQTFFNDAEEVEAQWAFIDKLISSKKGVNTYKSGEWGPKEADELIQEDGRIWLEPSLEFCRVRS